MSLPEQEDWAERAAIMEYMGGLTRDAAEDAAYELIMSKRPYEKEWREKGLIPKK